MLSPTVSVPPSTSPASPATNTGTRRRGLSYLRSLSSHAQSSASQLNEQSRTSPRSFFQRSTSYNSSDNKSKTVNRRRSASKPDEPTSPQIDALTRVTSAGATSRLAAEESSSGDDGRQSRSQDDADESSDMARARPVGVRRATESAAGNLATSPTVTRATNGEKDDKAQPPAIRFYPHQEQRNGRQSLNFSPISRILPSEDSVIRVGRYSEREGLPVANPTTPSDAPVGFKSKVVSRKHCEFLFLGGVWHIRDVASSSGTFLNHIRLSQPNQESKPFPIKDGDIVQLGIDFRGGEEMIFRCVKIRIECNRTWQKKPNQYNKTRRAQLLNLTKGQGAPGNNGECSICLVTILPNQALFVAPCAHVWHYKCVRPLLEGKQSQYPQLQCPNCRAYSDLEADVDVAEEDMDEWNENGGDTDQNEAEQIERSQTANGDRVHLDQTAEIDEPAQMATTLTSNDISVLARRVMANPASPEIAAVGGLEMPPRLEEEEEAADTIEHLTQQRTNTESPTLEQTITAEGPLTPRNNAGPFVFDGSGGSGARRLTVPDIGDEIKEEK